MDSGTSFIVFYALGLLWQLASALFGAPAGAFDMKLKQLDTCPDEGTRQVQFDTKINSVGNGKYTYNSTLSLQVPVDERFKANVDVQRWGNGGYKAYVEYPLNGCEDMWKYGGDMISSILKSAGADITHCPIPKGNYTVNNWEVNPKLSNIPVLPYGNFKVIATLYYKEVRVGCGISYIEIEPSNSAYPFKTTHSIGI